MLLFLDALGQKMVGCCFADKQIVCAHSPGFDCDDFAADGRMPCTLLQRRDVR